jgi:hypothetical protein
MTRHNFNLSVPPGHELALDRENLVSAWCAEKDAS